MSAFNQGPHTCAVCGEINPCEFCTRCRRYFCGCAESDGVLCSYPACGRFVCDECAGALESRLSVCRKHLEYGAEVLGKELREALRRIEAAAAVLVIADEQVDFAHFGQISTDSLAQLSGRLAGAISAALELLRK